MPVGRIQTTTTRVFDTETTEHHEITLYKREGSSFWATSIEEHDAAVESWHSRNNPQHNSWKETHVKWSSAYFPTRRRIPRPASTRKAKSRDLNENHEKEKHEDDVT